MSVVRRSTGSWMIKTTTNPPPCIPPERPPCSRGNCTVIQSWRHSWVLPAALSPDISVMPWVSIPPKELILHFSNTVSDIQG